MDLLCRMVWSELDHQCTLQGAGIEKRLYGVVGLSFIYAEVHEELYLVSWGVDNAYLFLQAPSTLGLSLLLFLPILGCLCLFRFFHQGVACVPWAVITIQVLGPCWGLWRG